MSKESHLRRFSELKNRYQRRFSDYLTDIPILPASAPINHTVRNLPLHKQIPLVKMLQTNKRSFSSSVFGIVMVTQSDIYGIEPSGLICTRVSLGDWEVKGNTFIDGKELMVQREKPLILRYKNGEVQAPFLTQQYNGSMHISPIDVVMVYEVNRTDYERFVTEDNNITPLLFDVAHGQD